MSVPWMVNNPVLYFFREEGPNRIVCYLVVSVRTVNKNQRYTNEGKVS